ncbi:MAG: adenosylcobinamide-phosphate synthase CbiB [Clostridia bacterium]|nr:adenosylcobinamide-phosphate synthase CbiB [Clostridia bacterium]
MTFEACVIMGFILDMLFGDPYFLPHPVVFMGELIAWTEKNLRKVFYKTSSMEIVGGLFLAAITISVSFILPFFILSLLRKISFRLGFFAEAFCIYQILAAKCLKVESMKVYDALKENDIEDARKKLSYLVGRDTQNLTEEEVIKATVETVAENTSDGVVAPLFYIMIGGAPLGFLYKAINTLDSMVGYKNEKYLYFGRVSAYLDDIANFIPSRVTGFVMAFSALPLGLDAKSAFKIFLRDRKKHLSPNSAQTESAAAGALGIQLGGTHDYFGKPVKKPLIGDNVRHAEKDDIKKVNAMMYATSMIILILLCITRLVKDVI